MTFSNFISRSNRWIPVADRPCGNLLGYFFKKQDPFSSFTLRSIGANVHKDPKVLVDPSVNDGKSIYLAVPFVYNDINMDDNLNLTSSLPQNVISSSPDQIVSKMNPGLAATLIDTITSYHMGEQNLPNVTMHVTSSLSVNSSIGTPHRGETLIALSQIDRIEGKLLFSQLSIIKDPSSEELDDWIRKRRPELASSVPPGQLLHFPSASDAKVFVRDAAVVVASGRHVKMFVDVPLMKGVPPVLVRAFSHFLQWKGF